MSEGFPRPGEQFGRYRIDRQIGFGGMGVVYAATEIALDRGVALKVISGRLAGSDEFRQRFHREAEILARLDSPHVITIFDHAEVEGTPYISTQFVRGGDVGDLITRGGRLPGGLAVRIAAQVADALHDAHQAGVVHRDVKPGNVLLRDGDLAHPHAYLCDFGIAQADSQGYTLTGSVSGTWAYLAPERGHGGPGTPASDIYATGCLLWTMLVGTPPYVGSDLEVALAHQQAPVPQLAGNDAFSVGINQILARTMAKDPAQRFANAAELRDALFRVGSPTSALSPATAVTSAGVVPAALRAAGASSVASAPARPRSGPSRALVGAAVLALVAAVAGGTWALTAKPWESDGSSATQGPPGTPYDGQVVTSDFDGDGFGDVMATYWSESENPADGTKTQLFLQHSDGKQLDMVPARAGAADTAPVLPSLGSGEHLLVANFDDDPQDDPYLVHESSERPGQIDFVPADDSDADFALRLPDGAFFLGAHAGDFTGDGAADVALAYGGTTGDFGSHDGTGTIAVWTNLDLPSTGAPRFMPAEDSTSAPDVWLSPADWDSGSISGGGADNFVVGDYDGDGRDDLAHVVRGDWDDSKKGTRTDSTVQLLLSDAAKFRAVGKPRKVADGGLGLARSGDFDDDGQDELAMVPGATDGPALRVLRATGSGWGAAQVWGEQPGNRSDGLGFKYPGAHGAAVGDYDGDGRDDLAVLLGLFGATEGAGAINAAVYVWLSEGERFAEPTSWADVADLEPGDLGTRQSMNE